MHLSALICSGHAGFVWLKVVYVLLFANYYSRVTI